jgi:uncharacterized protein YggE
MRRILLLLALASWPAITVMAQTATPPAPNEGPVVITTGEGIVKRAPDRVWVSVSAESRSKAPKDAQRANAEAMKAVLDKLTALGLPADAIRTSGYDLQPEFDYANGRQTIRDYIARNAVEIRVDDVSRAGAVLDAAVGSGATSVSGVRFDLKDRSAAEREALRKAVGDARGRADAAAGGAGMRVDRVLRIEEQRVMIPEPRPMVLGRQAMMAEAAQPPIVAGEIEVRVTVTMTSALK